MGSRSKGCILRTLTATGPLRMRFGFAEDGTGLDVDDIARGVSKAWLE
jgi:hypothetical protein